MLSSKNGNIENGNIEFNFENGNIDSKTFEMMSTCTL